MITKSDCYYLLGDIKSRGVDISAQIEALAKSTDPSIDVIKFIHSNRPLDLVGFYNKIRRSYNDKRSRLYINIMKIPTDPSELVTTLSSMLTQVIIYSRSVEDKAMFLSHARCDEISKALTRYFVNGDVKVLIDLLQIVKADIKVCEYISGRSIDVA